MKHHFCALEENQHLWMMVVQWINKLQGHWYQLCTRAVGLRPKIDLRMRWIATRQFNDLNTPMQIERNEVAGCVSCFMTDESIRLKGAWSTVVEIIPGDTNPI